jgi:quinol-cytochrome oxidoreductase complex cytochrome b subunit
LRLSIFPAGELSAMADGGLGECRRRLARFFVWQFLITPKMIGLVLGWHMFAFLHGTAMSAAAKERHHP